MRCRLNLCALSRDTGVPVSSGLIALDGTKEATLVPYRLFSFIKNKKRICLKALILAFFPFTGVSYDYYAG